MLFFITVLSPLAIVGVSEFISGARANMIFLAVAMDVWTILAFVAARRL
jgi:hypothetical protein